MPSKSTNHANRNITRIDLIPKSGAAEVRGWLVRIYRREERFNHFISDKSCGGKLKALEQARIVRDKTAKKLKPYTRREKAERITGRNTSGHRGVRLRITRIVKGKKKYVYKHVEASWTTEVGVVVKKSFSVEKLGLEQAWELGIACRKKAVAGMKG